MRRNSPLAVLAFLLFLSGCGGPTKDFSKEEAFARKLVVKMREVNDILAGIKTMKDLDAVEDKLKITGGEMKKLQKEAEKFSEGRSPEDVKAVSDKMAPILSQEQNRTQQILGPMYKTSPELYQRIAEVLKEMAVKKKK